MFDIYQNRENIEWTNTWIENCNDPNKEHVLVIGDSVARQFRDSLARYSGKSVDCICTSRAFDDPRFYNIFESFFKDNNFKYSKIYINIGTNHGFYLSTLLNPEDYNKYKESYEKFITYIQKNYSSEIIILLGTPQVEKGNLLNFNSEINNEISQRNNIHQEIAKKYNFEIIDLFNFIVYHKKYFPYSDNVHFQSKIEQDYIAKFILNIDFDFIDKTYFKKVTIYQKLFSIKNEYKNNEKHKVLTILGIKAKFKIGAKNK